LQPAQNDWTSARSFPEFVPQNYDIGQVMAQTDPNSAANIMSTYDPFSLGSTVGLAGHTQAQINPYATDHASLAGAAYFHNAGTFAQPVRFPRILLEPSHANSDQAQYHNYAPHGPHRENLERYQRSVHDFFIEDKLREDLQRKSEATLQILPSMKEFR
jgi:PAB-dependent poly(A)-specific ribonuclease subunit 3